MSEQKGALSGDLGVATGGGGVLGLANPEGADVLITRLMLDITTPATGTPTADAGVAAAATTSADDLIDGAAIGDAAKVLDNIDDQGTNGQATARWDSDEFLTITASVDPAGLVGTYYIEYVRV